VKKSRDAGEVRRRLRRFDLRSDIERMGRGVTQYRGFAGGSNERVCALLYSIGVDTLSTRPSHDRIYLITI